MSLMHTTHTMMHPSGGCKPSGLTLDFWENVFNVMLPPIASSVGFLRYSFIRLSSLLLLSLQTFHSERILTYDKCYCFIYWDYMIFLICSSNVMHHTDSISNVTWNKSNLVMLYLHVLLKKHCDSSSNISPRIFASVFMRDWPVVFLFSNIFVGFC